MTTLYLESSALFKKHQIELGTALMLELFASRTAVESFVTSRLTPLEIEAAGGRALKSGCMLPEPQRGLLVSFAPDLRDVTVMPVTEALWGQAAVVAWTFGPPRTGCDSPRGGLGRQVHNGAALRPSD